MAISRKQATYAVMLLFLALCFTVGCKPDTPLSRAPQSSAQSPLQTPQTEAPLLPPATPTIPVSILPTPTAVYHDLDATIAPSPTPPPVPTPLPTPVVTPIPVASPPFIPEVVGKAPQPFWIYYWQGNEVWRVDDQGKDRQLVIDTYKTLGQYLTDIPDPYRDSDCCWIGPRVVVSPDGKKLGLIVVDKIKGSKADQFTFSVYIYDVMSNDLRYIDEGVQLAWSPDSEHIAFRKGRGLWMADLETRQTRELVPEHDDPNMHVTEFVWSPDNTQIAYLYSFSMQRLSTVWAVSADRKTPPHELFSLEKDYPIYGVSWYLDGQQIAFLSQEGVRDRRYESSVQNLWTISLLTDARAQFTHNIEVQSYGFSPDHKWLFIAGYPLYETGHQNYARDLWLLSIDGKDLRRLTANQGDLGVMGWSPDGTRLIVWRSEVRPLLFSLADGTATVLDFDLGTGYQVGGVK
jgi:Tol biopolymer transport system component